LHVLRARSLAGLHSNHKASLEYDEALKLWPQDEQIQVEAHRNQGYCYIDTRQWAEAAAEFAKASELRPQDHYLWRFRAIAFLVAGDESTYRNCCSAMLDRFALADDQRTAANVLLVCVLTNDALPDMTKLLPLTHSTDRLGHWGAYVRGAALYRAGEYDEALACFERAADIYGFSAWDWCFLAMINHRLKRDEQAAACLANAANWIDEADRRIDNLNPHGEYDLTGRQPTWGIWYEPMIYRRLLRESEELLNKKPI